MSMAKAIKTGESPKILSISNNPNYLRYSENMGRIINSVDQIINGLDDHDIQFSMNVAKELKTALSTINYDTATYIMDLERVRDPDQFRMPMDEENNPCNACGGDWGGDPDCRDCASSPIREGLDDIEEEEAEAESTVTCTSCGMVFDYDKHETVCPKCNHDHADAPEGEEPLTTAFSSIAVMNEHILQDLEDEAQELAEAGLVGTRTLSNDEVEAIDAKVEEES